MRISRFQGALSSLLGRNCPESANCKPYTVTLEHEQRPLTAKGAVLLHSRWHVRHPTRHMCGQSSGVRISSKGPNCWGAHQGTCVPPPPLCKPPPPCSLPPPNPGDRHFHVFLVNMYCAGLCCPSALRMALHCFPITSNQAPVCVFCDILSPEALYGCVVLLLQTQDVFSW